MTAKTFRRKIPIKAGEYDPSLGDKAYIYFEEDADIPGLENTDIRIEFERNNTFAEISALVAQLKDKGFTFVVQRNS